ncbi:MAG: HAMP domain-containing histidine kinase, partial [Oscillospiraceae bacterium]|nr:HAMP domain-containing histidine kinase [Oscillospiraceae bacterium]
MKTKKKIKDEYGINLAFVIWLCFFIFIIIVFFLIWFFQIVLLSQVYERMKISDIKKATQTMADMYGEEDYKLKYDTIALNNDMCVLILNQYGKLIYSNDVVLGKSCTIHSLNPKYSQSQLIFMAKNSNDGKFYTKIENSKTNMDILLYGMEIKEVGYLFINTPLAPVAATTNILLRQLFIISDISIVLGVIISMFAARAISKPISRITKSASRLAKGDYTVKFNSKSYYEAQQLANTLNYATAQISKVDTQQRDLIANISHDLRTPLTMLKAYAEMIRDLSGNNPKKRNEHLNIIIEETDRLALLVSDMLDLSKLESDSIELKFSEFSITAELNSIVEHYRGLENGLDITFEKDEEQIVSCDKTKIEQVIYNLINNAINY